MTSTRPYLIRAFYDWIIDNKCTPYIVIDATKPGAQIPEEYVDDGKIVLNISQLAVRDLSITNRLIEFNAKFSGVPMQVYAPIHSVVAIYAHENGRGMVFSEDDIGEDEPPPPPPSSKGGKPKLTVVK
ncbi:MAG: ClpXP protease specificity-enhancing factor [Legionellales bacterium]|nr:ClpXP protease specificity-enhancing factor [Legionellales bacterium]